MRVTVNNLNNKIEDMKVTVNNLNNEIEDIKVKANNLNNEIEDMKVTVKNLKEILSNTNMVFEDIVILFELKGDCNNTFHQGWKKVNELKEQLEDQQFPAGMEKYKDPLQNLANASNTWIAWR